VLFSISTVPTGGDVGNVVKDISDLGEFMDAESLSTKCDGWVGNAGDITGTRGFKTLETGRISQEL
jgi:hypothetical protein